MTIAAAATATFAVIWLLRLLLPAHFLVSEVTGRSNHDHHARQIGGLAIVPVVAALMAAGTAAGLPSGTQSVAVSAAASAFGLLGLFDDLTDAGTRMRLFAQVVIAVTFVLGAGFAPAFLHAWMPAALASALVVVFLVGAVNMANFMDGLDLMSVAGLGLPLLAIGLIGSAGPHASGTYVAAALAGEGRCSASASTTGRPPLSSSETAAAWPRGSLPATLPSRSPTRTASRPRSCPLPTISSTARALWHCGRCAART